MGCSHRPRASLALSRFLGFQYQTSFSILLSELLVTVNIVVPPLDLQGYRAKLLAVGFHRPSSRVGLLVNLHWGEPLITSLSWKLGHVPVL